MKRNTAQTIFKTVVFAGAMLGSAAGCSKKSANTTPKNTQEMKGSATDPKADPAKKTDGSMADPCAGGERPRGTDDDGGGGMGRGFILS